MNLNKNSNDPVHKSGFVNIIGLPNVGKSTLMNFLLNDKLSIVTHKPQTTRHRILGILSGDNYQMILSDVPGFVENESYQMHRRMNTFVSESFEDADILILMVDATDDQELHPRLIDRFSKTNIPKILVINKSDLAGSNDLEEKKKKWTDTIGFDKVFVISAKEGKDIEPLLLSLFDYLPEGPPYFPKDQISNRNVRFFISEMVREQIFLQYRQEIPYSCEVDIERFKDKGDIIHIEAMIYVNRKSQKSIIIGKGGSAIKQLGIDSRQQIEEFVGKKVFLKLHVKVREKWRDNEDLLEKFGYH